MKSIQSQLSEIISKAFDVKVSENQFTIPPKMEMGDFAFPCFELAKELKKSPVEIATSLAEIVQNKELIVKAQVAGPYVNFYINEKSLIEYLEKEVLKNKKFGQGENKKQKFVVEFACPNTHKAFHIGHLRNIITGESISRILNNAGYNVIRANYQGDVGMHIAKALWGINRLKDEYQEVKKSSVDEKVKFLGKAYVLGAQAYESDEADQKEIYENNEKIYSKADDIKDVYSETRKWSLEYFDNIYKRIDTFFDRFYFESEIFSRGKKIVEEYLEKGVFKKSEGAIIFEGEKFGLHSRVFINSKGLPTYEAKDLALAELQFKEHKPERIIHVVGKEQIEYFKVIFSALEQILPETKDKEYHLAYGWVALKHGKMSSRTGKVVLGEWLLDEIESKISEIVEKSEVADKETTKQRVAMAAVKYSMLKVGIKVDMSFDIDESVNISGDSGPYLLYIGARINSILKKVSLEKKVKKKDAGESSLHQTERKVILSLLKFPEITKRSAVELDPSQIAKYLFDLAQDFNNFYTECSVLNAEGQTKKIRVELITAVNKVMVKGLNLLGIEAVEEM
jgi:arginyl-tRNA synthetase